MLAFMAHDRTRLNMACQRLVKFLKNQNAGRGTAALDLDVFCRRKVNVAAGFEPMLSFVDQDAGFAIDDVNKELISAGVALAFTVAFQRDEDLRKAGAHRGGNQNVAYRLLPTGQVAMNKTVRREQRVAAGDNVSSKTEEIRHVEIKGNDPVCP